MSSRRRRRAVRIAAWLLVALVLIAIVFGISVLT
jgi:predicted nucleic acid-binding Zn ribbon protein